MQPAVRYGGGRVVDYFSQDCVHCKHLKPVAWTSPTVGQCVFRDTRHGREDVREEWHNSFNHLSSSEEGAPTNF